MAVKNKVTGKYNKNCTVCQYMRKNPDFKLAVLNSRYFNPDGIESIPQVMKRYKCKIQTATMYAHFRRHQPNDKLNAHLQLKAQVDEYREREREMINKIKNGEPINGVLIDEADLSTHEATLAQFIKAGRAKLTRGEISINATSLLTAIKIQADIDKSNKDRKVDVFKTMFNGAAPTK